MDRTPPNNMNYRKLGPVGTIVTGVALIGIGCVLAFVLERSGMTYGAQSEGSRNGDGESKRGRS